MYKLVAAALLALVVYVAADCNNCSNEQCCIMSFGPFRNESCQDLGGIGDPCSELLPIHDHYISKCPCKEGLVCRGTGFVRQMNKKCQEAPTSDASPSPTPPTVSSVETTVSVETTIPSTTTTTTTEAP